MKSAPIWLSGLAIVAGLALPGCTTHKKLVLQGDPDEAIATARARSEALDEAPEDLGASTVAKGFFKPTRLPAAMSDEGSEIERSLGVYR